MGKLLFAFRFRLAVWFYWLCLKAMPQCEVKDDFIAAVLMLRAKYPRKEPTP